LEVKMRGVMAIAALVAAAGAAQAQVVVRGPGGQRNLAGTMGPLAGAPASFGVQGWRVGQWARYSITQSAGQMPITQVRTVSIVGQRGGQFWVETQDEFAGMMSARGPLRKMLIPFGALRERVGTEVYSLFPDSSARRETLVRAPSGQNAGSDFPFPAGWQRIGDVRITVTAGTFTAIHWRRGDEQLWTAADAGPLGIVRYESGDVSIELGSLGTDARSRIPFGG
jgi:hypothetical protein